MTLATTPMTVLEAVNVLLGSIGEAPISSLNGITAVDAITAKSILSEVSRDVQSRGWHFNTEENFLLEPTQPHNYIYLPADTLEVDTNKSQRGHDVVMRGNRLYDRGNRTYEFTGAVRVDLTRLLPYEDLPQSARQYIAVRAARVFQARVLGSQTLNEFTETAESEAWVHLFKHDARQADRNIGTGSSMMLNTIHRRR
jgi:hypothetical protein